MTTPRHESEIIVKLGKHDLSQAFERGSVVAYIYEIHIHPSWKFFSEDFDGDIAAIILETKVLLTDSTFPICLWNQKDPPEGSEGTVVGWGKSESAARHENIPRQLDVTIRTNEKCFLKNPRFAAISSLNTFCAGKDAKSGPCSGKNFEVSFKICLTT